MDMKLPHNARIGLAARFLVTVDGVNLGSWSSCKGLAVSFECEELEVGGNYEHPVLLPKRLKYNTISLTRAMTKDGSQTVNNWLKRIVDVWYDSYHGDDYHGSTASITLLDAGNDSRSPVATWSLTGVFPKAWKGPELAADSSKVATETLELVHQGFL